MRAIITMIHCLAYPLPFPFRSNEGCLHGALYFREVSGLLAYCCDRRKYFLEETTDRHL